MNDIVIEQAIYTNADAGGYRFVGRSPGFTDEWLHDAERICTGFGERPADVACPGCVFVQPLGRQHVAVVQAADVGTDDAGRPGALGFRFLVVPRQIYLRCNGDLFVVADAFPPDWQARDALPTLTLPELSPTVRTVTQLNKVLKEGDGGVLLGAVQCLVDGGRVYFERPAPAPELIRDIWMLLPTSTRAELWPATFAFGGSLGFQVLVTPRKLDDESYLTEEGVRNYPQSHYEHSLQIAVEAGDQHEVDRLLARRSGGETLRLALYIAIFLAFVAFIARLIKEPPPAADEKPKRAPLVERLPPVDAHYDRMPGNIRDQVKDRLQVLTADLEIPVKTGSKSIEDFIKAIDKHVGTPDPQRRCAAIELERREDERKLRVLLWKNGVEGFDDKRLNAVELVERLHEKLKADKKAREGQRP